MTQLIDLGKIRFNFTGDWLVGTTYEYNDVVRYGGNVYVYTYNLSTAGNLPTNTTYWALMIESFDFTGTYNPATAYKIGNGVAYGGIVYVCIADVTGTSPPNPTYWSKFVDGIQFESTFNIATAYQKSDVVVHGGTTYIAKQDTTGNAVTNTTYWEPFASGMRWRSTWVTATQYLKFDIVKSAVGSAYIANQDHTSGADFNADVLAGKWSVFAVGGADVIPTSDATDVGKSLNISNDGSTIDWFGATQSQNVYWVAPGGIDDVNHGKNLAAPFASIKYACSQAAPGSTIFVKTGTYSEQLPITIPSNVAIVGDNQRTVLVQPAAGLSDDGVTPNNQATMFLMSDGSILNKMTFKGMTGWVPGSVPNDVTTSTIKGVVVRLNPASPILLKSPYVLECAAICSGAIGALIDGSVHATGAKTMIFHGYTVISDNGIGYWVKDNGKAEIVSCFTYYCYFGYTASGGGFIRALNGNNSYGTWGATSRGFDVNETPVTGALVGQQLNTTAVSGNVLVGDTVTASSGGTATVTNVQLSANKIYVKNATGTFTVGATFTTTSGGAGTIAIGGLENQKGFTLVASGFSTSPQPGQSIQLSGDTYAYVIQSVSGTYVNSSSDMTIILAQEKPSGSPSGATVTLRNNYSQIRLTGHDFLNIGTGGTATTNYPGTPTQPPAQGNETNEDFPGRVYYVSTDQNGNFRVGEYFQINQATGRATLNASAFDLAGLTSLRLGSIGAQLGETINEFSSDATLAGNSNQAVPTEYAVKTYVDTAVSSIPLVNTISANQTLAGNKMTFSMGTLAVTGSAVYTVSTGAYHFVMNPNGFALLN